MTPAQFYGWSREQDWLDEPKAPRKETWLTKRMAEINPTDKIHLLEDDHAKP